MPALLAGVVAVAVTRLIERFGGLVGGLLGTLPTTIVPAAWGIFTQSQSAEAFAAAMAMTPAGMLINGLFLWLWRTLPGHLPRWPLGARLALMAALTLSVWAGSAALMVLAVGEALARGAPAWSVGALTLGLLLGAGVAACLRPLPTPKGSRPVGPLTLLARGGIAAAAIFAAVALSATGEPLLAGVASVFPAIFLTTMVSLWVSQGEAVPAGAVGPMILGSSAVSAYALIASWSLPALGPAAGSASAWILAALCVTGPATLWLRRRRRQQPVLR